MSFKLAWQQLFSQYKSGDLRVLVFALVLAVTTLRARSAVRAFAAACGTFTAGAHGTLAATVGALTSATTAALPAAATASAAAITALAILLDGAVAILRFASRAVAWRVSAVSVGWSGLGGVRGGDTRHLVRWRRSGRGRGSLGGLGGIAIRIGFGRGFGRGFRCDFALLGARTTPTAGRTTAFCH